MKNALSKIASTALLAAALVAGSALASGQDSTGSEQARYVRLHDAAVAFADAIGHISSRYGLLQKVDVAQARDLIRQSEVAARQENYEQANLHASSAYNMLRDSIRAAVESGQFNKVSVAR